MKNNVKFLSIIWLIAIVAIIVALAVCSIITFSFSWIKYLVCSVLTLLCLLVSLLFFKLHGKVKKLEEPAKK